MTIRPRLLDHPFYRAWSAGEVPADTLAAYHRSYADLVQRIPTYWKKVVNAFRPEDPLGLAIVEEERNHILLWESWGKSLQPPQDYPSLLPMIQACDGMTPSRLLGVLQAFEMQQPEVSATKKEGLLRHYGFLTEDLRYFDEHQREEVHIAYGRSMADRDAIPEEFERGFAEGAEMIYHTLDGFAAPPRGDKAQTSDRM
jgi:pyrroloquinoline-quinone synthase